MPLTRHQGVQSSQRAGSPGRAGGDVSLASSALWLVVGKAAAAVFNITLPLLLVRLLTVREFGVYKQLFLLLDTALVILPLGFALSAFYFFPREPARKAQVVGHIVLVHVLVGGLGGLLVAAFPALPAALLNTRDLAAYAPILGLAILLWVGSSFIEFVAIANGEARLAALVVLGMQLLRSAVLVAAGAVFGSVRALAIAAVIVGAFQSAVVLWYVRIRVTDTRRRLDWRLMRAQLVYALPLAYAGLFWWLQGFVHHYFVANRFGPAAYAVYAVGCFQLPIVNIVQESVGSVVIRRVNELRRRNETQEMVRLATQTVRTLAAFAFPVYALLLVMGREFITVLFTRQYLASWPIFAVNLSLIPLSIVAPICDAVFRACPEELPFFIKARTALAVPLLAGLWIATARFSLVGAVAVVVGVTLLERLVLAGRASRVLGLSWRDLGRFGDVARLGGAAGMAGVTTYTTRGILQANGLTTPLALLAICTVVFAIVYAGAVLLLRVPTPEEQNAVRQGLTRLQQVVSWRSAADAAGPEGV
ncbi:MAG TPA: lipopolysaccharide biosynthesis protein [bacterium]|nr:lipopolysaccharide biosynthesis protein [bacterium]